MPERSTWHRRCGSPLTALLTLIFFLTAVPASFASICILGDPITTCGSADNGCVSCITLTFFTTCAGASCSDTETTVQCPDGSGSSVDDIECGPPMFN